MTTAAVLDRHTNAISQACASPDSVTLFEATSVHLRKIVGFDGACWFGSDPTTLLPIVPVRIENVEPQPGQCELYWHREFLVEDVMLYRRLARARQPAATLYATTDGNPARSTRYREFLQPQGFGDELRAVFRVGNATWGLVDLFRDRTRSPFTARDVETVLALAPVIGTALRSLALSAAAPTGADGPGTALYDAAGRLCSLDERAERWFRELAGPQWNADGPERMNDPENLMTSVNAVLARAQAIATGRERAPASARLRTPTGRWVSAHASWLRDPDGRKPTHIAVVIEPAKASQIAPIIIEAYSLTPREQQITRAVARGLSNVEIANELHLSAHTVRDHVKATFTKVGVSSRGELTAKLFADHYEPQPHATDAAVAHVDF